MRFKDEILLVKKPSAKDQVTLLAGIQRYWRGYLLQLAGKVVLATAGMLVLAMLKHAWP